MRNESSITISENDADQRLDRFLRKAFRATPLSLIQKALRTKKIRVNGNRATADQRLNRNDTVTLPLEWFREKADVLPAPLEDNNFKKMILFENDDLLVLNKPAGVPVHEGTGHEKNTLADRLKSYLAGRAGENRTFRPAFAHRLDCDTSGVLIAGKNAATLRSLAARFREGRVDKEYAAVVEGVLSRKEGVIETPLSDKEGQLRAAITKYRVEKEKRDASLLSIRLMTGRTHQIRRHFAGLGHPILGDRRYDGKPWARLMLHARRATIEDCATGIKMVFEAPLPAAFLEFAT